MSENSGISWTDHTFNPFWGCSKVSPACKHCYAADWAARWGYGWGKDAPRRFFGEKHWREPLSWNAKAQKLGTAAFVFSASMADVFEERDGIPADTWAAMQEARKRLWDLVEATPWLVWLLLTKRPHLVGEMVPAAWTSAPGLGWPSNAWLGATMEDQGNASTRGEALLSWPAPVHFASYEPAVEAVDFSHLLDSHGGALRRLRWVIVGGESGSNARQFNVDWARSVVAQCRTFGAAPFVKQLGARPIDSVIRWAGPGALGTIHDKAGADPAEWPEDLRVQERPAPLPVRGYQGGLL